MTFVRSLKSLGVAAAVALMALGGSASASKLSFNSGQAYMDRTLLITASGKASKQIEPDQVTLQVKLSAAGKDVGSVVLALNNRQNRLLDAAKGEGADVVSSSVSALDVREDRRSRRKNGNPDEAYKGTMQLSLTMKFSNNPLALIAKVTDGLVEGISRTRFGVSDQESGTEALKAEALANARKQAEAKAKLLNAKLGRLVNVTYRETPHRSSYGNGAATLQVRAMATFQREGE